MIETLIEKKHSEILSNLDNLINEIIENEENLLYYKDELIEQILRNNAYNTAEIEMLKDKYQGLDEVSHMLFSVDTYRDSVYGIIDYEMFFRDLIKVVLDKASED